MKQIAFIDTETDQEGKKLYDIGCVRSDGSVYHGKSLKELSSFVKDCEFLVGHNILHHDLKFLTGALPENIKVIDTLFWSPLLFPIKPYHALLKDDKLFSEELNNPLNDAQKAKDLFYDELLAFERLDEVLKQIYVNLLSPHPEFLGMFDYLGLRSNDQNAEQLIRTLFQGKICEKANITGFISKRPVELAYALTLIGTEDKFSITPPWVLKNYPQTSRLMHLMQNHPCNEGCFYCNSAFDVHKHLKSFFGHDGFRTYGDQPLQEQAVKAAVEGKSLLAVFPTGGGKSITFQLPALMSGTNERGLTVVISPLQSLMKDQVDNLEKAGITEAATINGLLDPIEKAKSFERVEDGSVSILYISPESLRSRSMERLFLSRNVVRFVIDEAHCFSAWGQDFRVDYLYIGDFIKKLQEKKQSIVPIPVSCFTATARQRVIEDICLYFREKLNLELEVYRASASRANLHYHVLNCTTEEDKYHTLRDLIGLKNCPTIVYVSRTRRAYSLANRLSDDGVMALPYHGKMETREKSANQDAFISGDVQVMVATSAFGMGVDKKDVGLVVHYDISDSLENYVQEAGRAGRDERIEAECYVLYHEDDLSKHFILLNQTRLSVKEIQQIWKAIKEISGFRMKMSHSALEIARKAGWDDGVADIETRVKTAIAALEEAGYLKREQNIPRIFANSIQTKNAQEAIERIQASQLFTEGEKEKATRIIKKLFSSKHKKETQDEVAESRVDYISDHLGIVKEEVIRTIQLMREEKILADHKDLTAFISSGSQKSRSIQRFKIFSEIEKFLLRQLEESEQVFDLKFLNEKAEQEDCTEVNPHHINTLLNFWAIKNWIKKKNQKYSRNHFRILPLLSKEALLSKIEERHEVARFILEYLYKRLQMPEYAAQEVNNETLVAFSIQELKEQYENSISSFGRKTNIEALEDALFFLSRIDSIKIEGGLMVVYNQMSIERLETGKRRYNQEDHKKLSEYYDTKNQQIHIVGEYAKKMLDDYQEALAFVEDYFKLNYNAFVRKYFPGSRSDELKLKMTPAKFKKLFGELSPTQLSIIKDNESSCIVVAAGPGSGKTRVLVHKMASVLLMEDVKHEQLLMLTFSRAAATEFKKRLFQLVGNAAAYVEIKTFHSFCFDLLGRPGKLESSNEVIRETVQRISEAKVDPGRIFKLVLVIDEAQDMDADIFSLVEILMQKNEDMRVIAVGDDDQNIFEWRGSSAVYLKKFMQRNDTKTYELVDNYRSASNLVAFSNLFAARITDRLKEFPINPVQHATGSIRITQVYKGGLFESLVADVERSAESGTVAVLCRTNEEALEINGILFHRGIQTKLIQSNEGFNLYQLQEVRFVLSKLGSSDYNNILIGDDEWQDALRQLNLEFKRSSKLPIVLKMFHDFAEIHPKKKYWSDLENFIRESKAEDFNSIRLETVMVSTMHRVKGKEFDRVYMVLDGEQANNNEARRLLYVAMTRAKKHLSIHLNTSILKGLSVPELEYLDDYVSRPPQNEISLQLSHKDLWLDYFKSRQRLFKELRSGDVLEHVDGGCALKEGKDLLKFSKAFNEKLQNLKDQGFTITQAIAEHIVYWYKEEDDAEWLIVLPVLRFRK